jgi:hypothetical protein
VFVPTLPPPYGLTLLSSSLAYPHGCAPDRRCGVSYLGAGLPTSSWVTPPHCSFPFVVRLHLDGKEREVGCVGVSTLRHLARCVFVGVFRWARVVDVVVPTRCGLGIVLALFLALHWACMCRLPALGRVGSSSPGWIGFGAVISQH